VKAGKHRKYFARKNQKNNTNFITKSIVNMGGSISAGTVAQFVRNNQYNFSHNGLRICCVWEFETFSYPTIVKQPKSVKNSKCVISPNTINTLLAHVYIFHHKHDSYLI